MLSIEEQTYVRQEFYKHPYFLKSFDRRPIEIDDDAHSFHTKEERESMLEYKANIESIVARLTIKTFMPGQFICNKGDPGEEMYYIRSGTVGVYIERCSHDLVAQKEKMNYSESLFHKCVKQDISFEQLESEASELIVEKTGARYLSENLITRWRSSLSAESYNKLVLMISQLSASNLWAVEDLFLLGTSDPKRHFGRHGFYYTCVKQLQPNSLFGETSLVMRMPRNATLISLTETNLYCLSKSVFEEALGAFVRRAEQKKQIFFGECFKQIIPGNLLPNLFVLFPLESVNRGHVLCIKGPWYVYSGRWRSWRSSKRQAESYWQDCGPFQM
jgi:CRP-like cAMP-binding protein